MAVSDTVSSIQAGPLGVGFALQTKSLSVPIYQRAYAWKEEEAKTFVDDVLRALKAGKPEYFLGTVVAIETNSRPTPRSWMVSSASQPQPSCLQRSGMPFMNWSPIKGSAEQAYLFSEPLFSGTIQPKLRLSNRTMTSSPAASLQGPVRQSERHFQRRLTPCRRSPIGFFLTQRRLVRTA